MRYGRSKTNTHYSSLLARLLSCIGLLSGLHLYAQDSTQKARTQFYLQDGEVFMYGFLDPVLITTLKPTEKQLRKGRKWLEEYTRFKWNVHKVYPYAVKVAGLLSQVEDSLGTIVDPVARKAYLKKKEVSLFGEYEDDIRQMTRSQGKTLVKLVYRETGKATFSLIKDYKSGASAVFWQSIGMIFGINLKEEYIPEEEEMIEYIVHDLERGGYNIAYKQYAYSLP